MHSNSNNSEINLLLNKDEALVLSDWLHRFTPNLEQSSINEAYARVLYDLDALLEKETSQILSVDYKQALERAKRNVIGDD